MGFVMLGVEHLAGLAGAQVAQVALDRPRHPQLLTQPDGKPVMKGLRPLGAVLK